MRGKVQIDSQEATDMWRAISRIATYTFKEEGAVITQRYCLDKQAPCFWERYNLETGEMTYFKD